MKLTTIPIALIVMSIVVITLVGLFTKLNAPYEIVSSAENFSSEYDKLGAIGNKYEEVGEIVRTTEGEEGSGNFLTNVKKMWSAVNLFFESFGELGAVSSTATEQLQIPAYIRLGFLGIFALAFIAVLITIAVRMNKV